MANVVTNRVPVRELKARLSAWLDRARSGEVVEVTSHNRLIARIEGIADAPAAAPHPLQALITAGTVCWSGKKASFKSPLRLADRGKPLAELVLDDRC